MSPEVIAERLPRPSRRTRFAIAGAPAAWGVHLVGSWVIEGAACHDRHPAVTLSRFALRASEAALFVVALAVAVAALVAAWAAWRVSRDVSLDGLRAPERPDMLAALALLFSIAFVLAIVWSGLPALVLPLCESVR